MYIKEFKKKSWHERASKCGHKHRYVRESTYVVLRCDNCGVEFERARGSMDPKRISNNYFHVCKNCDAKVFAQKKGCLLYTSPSPRDATLSRMPSSA